MYLGSLYVNDFNKFSRTFQVIAQADADYRGRPGTSATSRCATPAGRWCPSARAGEVRPPSALPGGARYNRLLPRPTSTARPPVASGPGGPRWPENPPNAAAGMGFRMDRARVPGDRRATRLFMFPLCVLLVFLVLAATYEELDAAAGHHPDVAGC